MLSLAQGTTAVRFARRVITAHVTRQPTPTASLEKPFLEKHGVFVTLHTYPTHDLRGCIGIPYPELTLRDALIEAACSTTHDPRFPPLQPSEFDHILIEVTILSKPTLVAVKNPQEYLKKIQIGRDGIIIECAGKTGLFLPQVPVEQHWDVETYLSEVCMKAWLPADSWLMPKAKLYVFSGQIFTEEAPNGPVKETTLDGAHD